jgi:colanic acid/amylovoran biosynthesis glycosyltransferase
MNARTMKLAYFTSRYPAVSHTFIMREISALRAHGFEVATISQRTPQADQILAEADRTERAATCYILPPRWGALLRAHLRAAFTRPVRYLSALWFSQHNRPGGLRAMLWHLFYFLESVLLWDELRRRRIRHVHVHFAGPCATVAMIASRLGDLTYSMTVHGSTVFFDVHRALLRQKAEHARFVFCISEFTRAQVAAHLPAEHWEKLKIVHCGVDTGLYAPGPPRTGRVPHHLLCVARLMPAKGISLLLEAVAELAESMPDLRCTLVGDGPDRQRLEQVAAKLRIADRITFTGAVGQDDIRPFYAAADAFVLPSFAEGVPVVLMEAMAAGVPVVATAVGGTSELVLPEQTGLLIPPGSVSALTDALRRILTDGELRERLATGGRAKVLDEFDLPRIGEQVAELFRQLLAESFVSPSPTDPAMQSEPLHAHHA